MRTLRDSYTLEKDKNIQSVLPGTLESGMMTVNTRVSYDFSEMDIRIVRANK